jgi:hypothetical protein
MRHGNEDVRSYSERLWDMETTLQASAALASWSRRRGRLARDAAIRRERSSFSLDETWGCEGKCLKAQREGGSARAC